MTFGTRTLAQVFPESAHAQQLRRLMWPGSAEHRGPTDLDETIARLAVRAALAPHVADRNVPVTFVKCVDLHWPRGLPKSGHVGSRPEIMSTYAQADAMQDIARQCLPREAAPPSGGLHVIAFRCNAGEHRSVCAAELLSGYLTRKNEAHTVFHLCRPLWGRRSCGGCRECDPRAHSHQREGAHTRFAWLTGAVSASPSS